MRKPGLKSEIRQWPDLILVMGSSVNYKGCVKGLGGGRALAEEAGVEDCWGPGGDFDAGGVGMEGVQEVVEGVGEDGGGDAGEGGAFRLEPGVA